MIVVVGSDAALFPRIVEAAESVSDVEVGVSLEGVRSRLGEAWALILALRAVPADLASNLAELRLSFPLLPCYLVTRATSENVELVYGLRGQLTDLVWEDRLGTLVETLQARRTQGPLERLYDQLRRRSNLPDVVREAISTICLTPPRLER